MIPLLLLIFFFPTAALANTCVTCHSELEGALQAPVKEWEQSIHFKMGNSCEGCHGGDPTDMDDAMNPAKGFVGKPDSTEVANFCGKCHVGVFENYKKSLHHAAALEGYGPTCVTCHQSHPVQKASFDLINEKLCTQCHSYANGKRMKEAFTLAEGALQDKEEELHFLMLRGMNTKPLDEKWFALRNSFHQTTHTLDVAQIELQTQTVLKDLEEMNETMETLRRKIYYRWKVGAGVAAFLIVIILLLRKLLANYEEEE